MGVTAKVVEVRPNQVWRDAGNTDTRFRHRFQVLAVDTRTQTAQVKNLANSRVTYKALARFKPKHYKLIQENGVLAPSPAVGTPTNA